MTLRLSFLFLGRAENIQLVYKISIEEDPTNDKSNGVQSTLPYKYSQSYFFFPPLLIFYGSISKLLKMQPGIYTLVHLEWLYVRGKPSPPVTNEQVHSWSGFGHV